MIRDVDLVDSGVCRTCVVEKRKRTETVREISARLCIGSLKEIFQGLIGWGFGARSSIFLGPFQMAAPRSSADIEACFDDSTPTQSAFSHTTNRVADLKACRSDYVQVQ